LSGGGGRGGGKRKLGIDPLRLLLILGCCALGLMLLGVALGGPAGATLAAVGLVVVLSLGTVFVYLLMIRWLHGVGTRKWGWRSRIDDRP
jgi:hypothetical protein